jgi:hypothetical protein
MDFNKLMQTMRDLDRPVSNVAVEACGDSMMSGMMPPMSSTPAVTPPSMSVNLNAQGMDSIESLLKLMTKVNPDMINQPMPSLTPPGPSIAPLSLGNLDKGPLKMLPDFDKAMGDQDGDGDHDMDDHDMEKDEGHMDAMQKAMGDQDGDGDHDMDDHDMEKDDSPMDAMQKAMGDQDGDGDHDMDDHKLEKKMRDKEKDESYANEPDPEVKSVDYMNNQLAGGMNKPKGTHPKVAGGDNPMNRVREGTDLRASIRAELLQRLAEAKGAK